MTDPNNIFLGVTIVMAAIVFMGIICNLLESVTDFLGSIYNAIVHK